MRGERRPAEPSAKVHGAYVCCALVLLAAGAGCTPWREYFANGFKVGPNYHTPPAPVAADWIDAADQRIHTNDPDLSHWWTVFNDDELNELIQAAYQQNLTLREAGFRILQARAALAIQVGNLFAQNQQAFGAWSRNSISTLAANQQLLPQQFFDDWNLGFAMGWELDFWGRFRRAIEAAEDDLDASVFNYDDVLVTLLGDVAATYVEIRTIQQQLEYVRQNVAIQQESLTIAQARFRGGLTSDLDVEQAISNLAQTEALIPQFEIQLRQANNRLCVLLGIPTEDLTRMMNKAPIPTAPPDVAIGIPAQLLTRRPDIRRAEREAAAQCARIGIAESELYPRISITGDVGFEAERFTDLFKGRSLQGQIGPGFQWNILNYGRLVNAVRFEEALFEELVTRFQNVVLRANADVEDGLVEFLQSQQQAKSMKQSVDAAEKAVQLAIVQYRGGLVDFNRVALLEQNLVQQQDLYAQAQGGIALGLVRVYRALGGGWQLRYQPQPVVVEDGAMMMEPTVPEVEELPPGERLEPLPLPDPTIHRPPSENLLSADRREPPSSKLQSSSEKLPQQPTDDIVSLPAVEPTKSDAKPMSAVTPPQSDTPPEDGATRLFFPSTLQHAGVLPEDRGEIRHLR